MSIERSYHRSQRTFRFYLIGCWCLTIMGSVTVQPSTAQGPAKTQNESTASEANAPELNAKNAAAWRDHIRPSTEELAWTQIDWLPDLKSGLEEAAKTNKPILLWTMNGHPMGCT